MKPEVYNDLIERLRARYTFADKTLYERSGIVYPFILYPSQGEDVHTLLGPAPTQFLSRENLPIYEESLINAIIDQGGKLYNGYTFALDRIERNPLRVHAFIGTYFDHIATCFALENELTTSPTTPLRDHLHRLVAPQDLLFSGIGRSVAIGVNTLIVFKKEGKYQALFMQRSAKTALRPGAFHVIPAFTLQPSSKDYDVREWDLVGQIKREYLEELFGVEELEDTTTQTESHPLDRGFDAMLSSDAAELHFTGFTINLMTTHMSFCTLLLIHDPDWYQQFGTHHKSTWETNNLYELPIDSDQRIIDALPENFHLNLAPNGGSALWLGIDAARGLVTF